MTTYYELTADYHCRFPIQWVGHYQAGGYDCLGRREEERDDTDLVPDLRLTPAEVALELRDQEDLLSVLDYAGASYELHLLTVQIAETNEMYMFEDRRIKLVLELDDECIIRPTHCPVAEWEDDDMFTPLPDMAEAVYAIRHAVRT